LKTVADPTFSDRGINSRNRRSAIENNRQSPNLKSQMIDLSIRSIIAVLGGIGLFALVTETLEFTLVTAAAGGAISDMAAYFAVRNRPVILAAKLLYNTLAAILAGYMTAKIAGLRELLYAALVAIVQTMALVWGSPPASTPPSHRCGCEWRSCSRPVPP
jgi:hypothetical protein